MAVLFSTGGACSLENQTSPTEDTGLADGSGAEKNTCSDGLDNDVCTQWLETADPITEFDASFRIYGADGDPDKREFSGTVDMTEWVKSFPLSDSPRGEIKKTIENNGVKVEVGYYRFSDDEHDFLASEYNIIDFSFEVDGEGHCYNSIYLKDLKEIPQILQSCSVNKNGVGYVSVELHANELFGNF